MNVPSTITAGDKVTWTETLFDYPATSWSLAIELRSKDRPPVTITATPSGIDFSITVLPADSKLWKSGIYNWQAYAYTGSPPTFTDKRTIERGTIEILPNLTIFSASDDPRSHVKKVLDALEAVIEGKASSDQLSYSIAGRSISKMNPTEILQWRISIRPSIATNLMPRTLQRESQAQTHRGEVQPYMSKKFDNLIQVLKNLPAVEGALLVKEYREQRAAQERNVRMYSAAKQSRLTAGWGQMVTSADYELQSSLRVMRARARQLIRDAGYAKRAKTIVVNNVVGSGIGMQAQVKTVRGELNDSINNDIEETWEDWCLADTCHTGGILNFADIERLAMGQVFDVGEIFIRKYFRTFGASKIPFALEVIEPERLVEEFQPSSPLRNAIVRMGIEVDEFRRPIAYWIRKLHPGEYRYSPGRRMPTKGSRRSNHPPEGDGPLAPDSWRTMDACRDEKTKRHRRILRGGNHRGQGGRLLHGDHRNAGRIWADERDRR